MELKEPMKLFDGVLDALAKRLQKRIYGIEQSQAYRDAGQKGSGYSVESIISENIANLTFLNFEMPISGSSERAKWLDHVSNHFCRDTVRTAVSQAFLTGDCLTVPSWNGKTVDNVLVDASRFAILGAVGDELTSVIYVVDEKAEKNGKKAVLLRMIDLVKYEAEDGSAGLANRYKTFVSKDGKFIDDWQKQYPDWAAENEDEWIIPNVSRLLVSRYKSFTKDPKNPNAAKGCPICFGASKPIREIHYLLDQLHNEFELSEKVIFADKRMFVKRPVANSDGIMMGAGQVSLPKGKERLIQAINSTNGDDAPIKDWSPSIQMQPYLDNLDFQFKQVEKCVGVNSGVISEPNDMNYQNVDNVRKSTIQTQSFINKARGVAESYMSDLVEIWSILANYYGINPVADYDVQYKWSDEYINTFSEQQAAILAGEAIGATDALDYRQFVMGESPEVARMRVEEINAAENNRQAAMFAPIKIDEFA